MDRRQFVKGVAATAAVASVATPTVIDALNPDAPHRGATADGRARGPIGASADQTFPPEVEAPAPWFLLAPHTAGAVVWNGWRLRDVRPVVRGGFEILLSKDGAPTIRVAVSRRQSRGHAGVAMTDRFDLLLVNGGHGAVRTPEGAGKAMLSVAEIIASNEHTAQADALPILTYAARNRTYGKGVIV